MVPASIIVLASSQKTFLVHLLERHRLFRQTLGLRAAVQHASPVDYLAELLCAVAAVGILVTGFRLRGGRERHLPHEIRTQEFQHDLAGPDREL